MIFMVLKIFVHICMTFVVYFLQGSIYKTALGHVKLISCWSSPPASFLGAASYFLLFVIFLFIIYLFIYFFWIFFFFFFFERKKTWKTLLKWLYFWFKKKKNCRRPSWKKNSLDCQGKCTERPFWAAILSGHFEIKNKKGPLLPIFRKNRTLNMFFFLFGLIFDIWYIFFLFRKQYRILTICIFSIFSSRYACSNILVQTYSLKKKEWIFTLFSLSWEWRPWLLV